MKKILLLDGYNLIYRAHYAPARGEYSTVYCFFRSLRAQVEQFDPDKIYFVLEGYPKKRMEMFEDYKGTRKKMDPNDTFHSQKKTIISILKNYFPISVIRHPEYECDDVLASLVSIKHKDDECIVVSSDTDFYQLYNTCNNVKIFNPVKKKYIPRIDFDYVRWKALKGDSSDNIVGFPGIGNKRAMALIENPEKLESFLSEGSRRATFNRNVSLIKFHDLSNEYTGFEESLGNSKWDNVRKEFKQMAFNSIINEKSWKKFVNTFTTDRLMFNVV